MVVNLTGKIAVKLPEIIKGATVSAYKNYQKKKEEQIKREQDEIENLGKTLLYYYRAE